MLTPKEYSFATPDDLGSTGNYRRFCDRPPFGRRAKISGGRG